MLVLTRKEQQTVVIGDQVEVLVVEIRGDKVRLGFKAPSDVTVHRKEVWLKVKAKEGLTAAPSES